MTRQPFRESLSPLPSMRAVAATHRSAYAVSGRPAWLNFNPTTRVLSGTPDAVGTLNLTYVVRDADGDEATDAFTVTVAEPDTIADCVPDVPDQSAVQGVAFSTTLDCGQRRQRTAHLCCQRASCMAGLQSGFTRVLSGTPDATGTHDLVYLVRDADGDEATDAFTFTVAEPDTTPTAPDVPDQSAIQGVAFSVYPRCGQWRQRTAQPCRQRASCMAGLQSGHTGSERHAGRCWNTRPHLRRSRRRRR